jgi:hypothetical protein
MPSVDHIRVFFAFLAPKRSKVKESTTFVDELRPSLRLLETHTKPTSKQLETLQHSTIHRQGYCNQQTSGNGFGG